MTQLTRKRIIPESRAQWLAMRAECLNSTEISALFGCSPYTTKFELWHEKKRAEAVDKDPGKRARWGKRLEDAIARGHGEDTGAVVRKKDEYVSIPALRIGSSYDYEIEGPPKRGLEVKNVDALQFKEGWLIDDEDGELEAPEHIEFQLQHQLLVDDTIEVNEVAALVGGNRIATLTRERLPKVQEAILAESAAFWESIDANRPPPPEYPRDAEFVCKLFSATEDGSILDATGNTALESLAIEYARLGKELAATEDLRKTMKAQMLQIIGTAEKVVAPTFSISAKETRATIVETYTRKAFRSFRVYPARGVGQ